MRETKIAAFVLMLIPFAASAQKGIFELQIEDGKSTGTLGEERYPGHEHTNVEVVDGPSGEKLIALFGMNSKTVLNGVPVDNRMQCAFTMIKLDAEGITTVTPNQFVTKNYGNRYRNCNRAVIKTIPGTERTANPHFILAYGYAPNSNTETWVKVIGGDAKTLSSGPPDDRGKPTDQLQISETNGNNNGTVLNTTFDSAGFAYLHYQSQGNGAEDSNYLVKIDLGKQPDGTYKPSVVWRTQTLSPCSIARGSVEMINLSDNNKEVAVACSAVGDARPAPMGVMCAVVDPDGVVLYRDYVMKSDPANKLYAMEPRIAVAADHKTILGIYTRSDLKQRGGGNGSRGKGKTRSMVFALRPDSQSLNAKLYDLNEIPGSLATTDDSHPTMCATHMADGKEVVHIVNGAMSNAQAGQLRDFIYDPSTQALSAGPVYTISSGNMDAGRLSNQYGANPNRQGRNILNCRANVTNPGVDNPKHPLYLAEKLTLIPVEGLAAGEDKLGLSLSFVPVVRRADPGSGMAPTTEAPKAGGCSVAGQGGAPGAVALLLFAAVALVRRRFAGGR